MAMEMETTQRKRRVQRIVFLRRLGRGLAGLRKGARLRQIDLARELGVTKHTISRWENGRNEPGRDLRVKLDARFGKLEEVLDIDPENWSNA